MTNKISILMPAFNEELHIADAVASVAEENKENNIELIIIDDGSTDKTWSLIEALVKKHQFIRAFKNPKKGKNSAFNLAYEKSSGNIIILFAADDILPPGSIKKRTSPINKITGPCVTGCKYKTFSKNSKFDGIVTPRKENEGGFSGGTIAFNREFAKKIFPIPLSLGNEDAWINCHIKFSSSVHLIHVPKIGLLYRIHDGNSLRRDIDFSKKSRAIHDRSIVFSVFLERYRETLTESAIEKLSILAALETLRWRGSLLSLIFIKNTPAREKTKALIYSNRLTHWIYINFYHWLSGR